MKLKQLFEMDPNQARNIQAGDWIWPEGLTLKPGETAARKVSYHDRKNQKLEFENPDGTKGSCTYAQVGSWQDQNRGRKNY